MAAEPKNIDHALLMLQADPPVLKKNRDGQVGNQRTKYADLIQAHEVILPKLFALGVLWWTAPTLRMIAGPNGQQDPRFVLDWELKHVASETKREGSYPLPAGANPMQNGSAITYARRYALLAATNAVAEEDDDDGQGYAGRRGMAQRATARQEQRRPAAPTAQRAEPAPRAERARPAQQPPLPEPPASGDGPRMISGDMVRKLVISMRAIGLDSRDGSDRKAVLVDMIGRDIASSKELTFEEGRAAIDAAEKAAKADNPLTAVIEIYHRTMGGGQAAPAAGRTAREQTRDSVVGRPAGPDDEPPPWDDAGAAAPGGDER